MTDFLLILSIICLAIFIFSITRKIGNFLNIGAIVINHLSFFKDNKLQFVSIYIFPIVFALYISTIRTMNRDIFDTLVIFISIFMSMFFAILSILCAIDSKVDDKKYNKLLEETFISTVFEIIVCTILLIISFCAIFIGNAVNEYVVFWGSTMVYYLLFIFVLNIFVVVKRIEILFTSR